MRKLINDVKRFISGAVNENRYTTYLVVYLLVLVWFRMYIGVLYQVYGTISTTLVLGFLPLTLTLIHYRKRSKQSPLQQTSTHVVRQIGEHQVYTLRKHTPTAQLNLLDDVLLVSLGLLYDLLSSLSSKTNCHQTWFDDKYQAIIRLFKTIAQRAEFINATVATRSQNNAVVCFAYYRILFAGVLQAAKENNKMSEETDPWILLKRIPPNITQHLGAQNWRLYELKTLLFGDLTLLEVNADIKALLLELCAPVPPAHLIEDTQTQESIDILPNAKQIKQQETKQNLAVKDKPLATSCQQPELTNPDLALISKFQKWLPRQIQRRPINQDNYFYLDTENYDSNTLFISMIALSDFAKKSQNTLDEVKQSLIKAQSADKKIYQLQGDSSSELIAIKLDFAVEVIEKNQKKIMEKAI